MEIRTERFRVASKANTDIIDITPHVERILYNSGMTEGQITVFAPGATAGISTIE